MKASIALEKVFVSPDQLAAALVSLTDEQKEALSILLDKEAMQDISESEEDIKAGRLLAIEQWGKG